MMQQFIEVHVLKQCDAHIYFNIVQQQVLSSVMDMLHTFNSLLHSLKIHNICQAIFSLELRFFG